MMFCNLYVCVKICFNEITKLRVSSNKLVDFCHAKQIHFLHLKPSTKLKLPPQHTNTPTSKTMKSAAAIVALAASAAAFAPAPINTKSSALNTVWDD